MADVAKWLTHLIVVQAFVGSIPTAPAIYQNNGGCGEVVNAPDCGSGIRGFDSHHPPFLFLSLI